MISVPEIDDGEEVRLALPKLGFHWILGGIMLAAGVGMTCLGICAIPIQALRHTGPMGWKIAAILVVFTLFVGVTACVAGAGFLGYPLRAWLRRERFVLGRQYFQHVMYDDQILSRFGFDNIKMAKVVAVYDRNRLGDRCGKPVKYVGVWLHYPKRPGVILEPRLRNPDTDDPERRELETADMVILDLYHLSPEELARELESRAIWSRNVPKDGGPVSDSEWAGL